VLNICFVVGCSNVTIEVTQGDKPVKVLCPGGQYEVKVCAEQLNWAHHTALHCAAAGALSCGANQQSQPADAMRRAALQCEV
jgi:hypothetical protein